MQAENSLDWELVEQAILHHGVAAASLVASLLRRLKYELHDAVELSVPG